MSLKSTTPIEPTTSYSCISGSTNRSIYIDEPIFCRADINDDGDFADSEEQFYYTTNNLYCVTALLDTSGNIIERYEYTPYGELTVYTDDGGDSDWWDGDETTGSLAGNYYTFTGRRSDPEAGLMYYRNRYYSAELGRFVSRDLLEQEIIRAKQSFVLASYWFGSSARTGFFDPYGLVSKDGTAACDIKKTLVAGDIHQRGSKAVQVAGIAPCLQWAWEQCVADNGETSYFEECIPEDCVPPRERNHKAEYEDCGWLGFGKKLCETWDECHTTASFGIPFWYPRKVCSQCLWLCAVPVPETEEDLDGQWDIEGDLNDIDLSFGN